MSIEQRFLAGLDARQIDADQHWHPARAGQDRNVAGGSASLQHEPALTPVGRKEARRGEILGQHDGAGGDGLLRATEQSIEHAVAQIAEIRRSSLKISILGCLVVLDERVHHLTPGSVGGLARIDANGSGTGDFLVLQQRELEGEYGGRLLVCDMLRKLGSAHYALMPSPRRLPRVPFRPKRRAVCCARPR